MERKDVSFEQLVLEYLSGIGNELDHIASSVDSVKKSIEKIQKDNK